MSLSTTDNIISYCDCSSSVFEDTFISDLILMKWRINDVLYRNVTFLKATFDSVLFNDTKFMDCKFQNSTFIELFFYSTDFNGVHFKFVNILPSSWSLLSNQSEGTLTLEDVTMNASVVEFQDVNISELRTSLQSQMESVCSEDLYFDLFCRSDDLHVYRDSFIVSFSGLPGYIVFTFAVYYFPRNYWLGKYYNLCNAQQCLFSPTTCPLIIICHCAFFHSAITMFALIASVILLSVVTSEAFVITMLSLFNAISNASWIVTSLITAELYPTHLCATSSSVHLLMARIGAIIGTNIFGLFVKMNPSIPILLVASVFLVGSLSSVVLPKTTRDTLLK